jgi:benzoate/toluate 1,2-dioxygenase alpha subunit
MIVEPEAQREDAPAYDQMVVDTPTDFRVRTRVYTDPQVFADELRAIFETGWIYVAHESEVRNPGDYQTAHIGRQPVIVSRAAEGTVHVLLNACRHRGNVVCREERGTANFFRCAYHGWVYRNTGALVGVAEPEAYQGDPRTELIGLVPAPRVATYRGLIFASLAAEGESLEEYLGAVREYVDLWANRSPSGNVRLLRPHKYVYPGNWKFQTEQDTDGYHGRYVHESAFKTLDHFNGPAIRQDRKMSVHGIGRTIGFPGGHCLLERPGTRGELPSELLRDYMDRLVQRHGAERAERIASVRHVLIFPNVYLMDGHLRVHQPLAVDRTEVRSYFNAFEDAPEAINKARLRNLQWRHSQAGFVGTDDVEMFIGCQSGMRATAMEWLFLRRGLHTEEVLPDGVRIGESSAETPQRAIYREWARRMRALGQGSQRPPVAEV